MDKRGASPERVKKMTQVYEQKLIGNVWYDVIDPWGDREIEAAQNLEEAMEWCDQQLLDLAAEEDWEEGYHDMSGWQIIRVFEDLEKDCEQETVEVEDYTASCFYEKDNDPLWERGMFQSDFL